MLTVSAQARRPAETSAEAESSGIEPPASGPAQASGDSSDRASRVQVPRARRFVEELLALTDALAEARSSAEVARVVLEQAADALEPREAVLWSRDLATSTLSLLDVMSATIGVSLCGGALEGSPCAPARDAVIEGEVVWLPDRATLFARYPETPLLLGDPCEERSIVCAPLFAGSTVVGCLEMLFDRTTREEPGKLDFVKLLARYAGLALFRACADEQAASERAEAERARFAAEQTAARMARLQAITSELSESPTPSEVAAVIVVHAATAVGALGGSVVCIDAAGTHLDVLAATGFPEAVGSHHERIPLESARLIAEAAQLGTPIFVRDADNAHACYPQLSRFAQQHGVRSACALPLLARGRAIGVLGLAFTHDRDVDQEDRAFLTLLARECAQALDRAHLYSEAQHAIRLRDDFLGIAGHELKTPLTALQLGLQSLGRQIGDNPVAEKRLGACMRSIERLNKLTGELLDVSRINADRLTLELDWVDLAAVVRDVAARTRDEMARAGCEVVVTAPESVIGLWDRARLEQVTTKLLANAVKYGKGKPVEVTLESNADGARLSVRDHGIGIAEADRARIFERFERAVSERHYGGLGLGLFIVQRIVSSLGGVTTLESALGRGSTFTVELPLTQPHGGSG
jgi:signal transduction histidine kinase